MDKYKDLEQQLKHYRNKKAIKANLPGYCIFDNKSVEEITQYLPTTFNELRNIRGFREKRLEKYGQDVIDIVVKYVKDNNITKTQPIDIAQAKIENQNKNIAPIIENIILECVENIDGDFGKSGITKILKGSNTVRNTEAKEQYYANAIASKYFGCLSNYTGDEIKNTIDKLLKENKLKTENSFRPILKINCESNIEQAKNKDADFIDEKDEIKNLIPSLTEENANEILELNDNENYSYEEKLNLCKQKYGELLYEHTNFESYGRYGALNQYILEAYYVLNKFTSRRWTPEIKISADLLVEDAIPVEFQLTRPDGQKLNYCLYNFCQTKTLQERNQISNEDITKRNLIEAIANFVSKYDGVFGKIVVVKILTGEFVGNEFEIKQSEYFGKFHNKYANILLVLIDKLIKYNKLSLNSNNKLCYVIQKEDKKESNEDLKDFNEIVKLINQGKNIFVTGNAGTGKSYLLNKLKQKYKKKLELTSTTGLAAVNIKGVTIHSWGGVGICQKTIEKCVRDILGKKSLVGKIRKCKLLAIDEISMLKGSTFSYIDEVLRIVRDEDAPFGGIQLLLFGDFFQLPPVEQDYNEKDFCFETQVWKDLDLSIVKLEKIYRQSDTEFIKALNDIREGCVDKEDINLLKSREITYDTTNSSILHIFSRNHEADSYNIEKFNSLNSKVYSYKADMGVYRGKKYIKDNLNDREQMTLEIFQKNCKASNLIEFKKGCRVMLLINLDFEKGLINGSCGEVIGLDEKGITVRFDNGVEKDIEKNEFEYFYNDEKVASITQYPLKLAYAITIHKSQGMTLENVVVDCNIIFEEGQTYVALSRVKSLKGLYLKGFTEDKIKVNQKVVDFYNNI